jgi:FtsP/CotA-like multicopper oxidase with cupredoxin domain
MLGTRGTLPGSEFGSSRSGAVDTVVVNANKIVAVDFTTSNPRNTLFHWHQQLHMDFVLWL